MLPQRAFQTSATAQQQPCLLAVRHIVRRGAVTRSYVAVDDPVVTTAWLADRLDDVTVVDVRGHVNTQLLQPGVEESTYLADYDAYLDSHIPGAVFWDWTKDAIDTAAAAPVQLQSDPDLLAAALEAKGISNDKPVVAYDAGDGMMAARLWWMLTVAGHPSVYVLEGGWSRWRDEQRPSELYEPCTLKVYGCFEADNQPGLRATLQDLQQLQQLEQAQHQEPGHNSSQGQQPQQQQQQQPVLLIDTRNTQQFTGEVRRGPRGGHIPGAVSLPRAQLLCESSGWFKGLSEQQLLLQQAGVVLPSEQGAGGPGGASSTSSAQRVVLYCNGGVAACTAALALHRLGHRNWAVYDGSWNEYGCTDLPVVNGSQ